MINYIGDGIIWQSMNICICYLSIFLFILYLISSVTTDFKEKKLEIIIYRFFHPCLLIIVFSF